VASMIARTLKVPHIGKRPIMEALKDYLGRPRPAALLLLDNFEQVLAAAPIVSELLEACALKILRPARPCFACTANSFPFLHWVRILTLPPPEARLMPAVALFVQRAVAVKPDFALTSDNGAVVAESVSVWMAFPWRSNWQPPASRCCRRAPC
jgi:predicted ATPase